MGLVWLTAALASVAAGVGLVWRGGSAPDVVTTVRGQPVQLYGQGLYRFDTVFVGAGQRGTDAVVLVVGVPLLLASLALYRRGSRRGRLLLLGTLGFVFYVYASAALGTVAYNSLFLVYVSVFSASLFGFILVLRSVDPAWFAGDVPRRLPATFMIASGAVTLVVWTMPLVAALLTGQPPDRLDHYTTPVTYALDLAIITPAAFLAGALMLRNHGLGYVIAVPLLVIEVMLAPLITSQTVSQLSAGVALTPGEVVGPVAGFVVLALVAGVVLLAILRHLPPVREPPGPRRRRRQGHDASRTQDSGTNGTPNGTPDPDRTLPPHRVWTGTERHGSHEGTEEEGVT